MADVKARAARVRALRSAAAAEARKGTAPLDVAAAEVFQLADELLLWLAYSEALQDEARTVGTKGYGSAEARYQALVRMNAEARLKRKGLL